MAKKIIVSSGASGVFAVILTLLFGFVGAFFSWWLIARWGFLKSFLYALLFACVIGVSISLCFIVVGYILLPIVWIVMMVMVYKACSQVQIEIAQTE